MVKKILKILSLLLLCFSFCCLPGTALAQSQQQEMKLTSQLLIHLEELQRSNVKHQEELLKVENYQLMLSSELNEAKKQVRVLENQLLSLELTCKQTQNSLESANASFENYSREMKRKEKILRLQRNLWAGGVVLILFNKQFKKIIKKLE